MEREEWRGLVSRDDDWGGTRTGGKKGNTTLVRTKVNP